MSRASSAVLRNKGDLGDQELRMGVFEKSLIDGSGRMTMTMIDCEIEYVLEA